MSRALCFFVVALVAATAAHAAPCTLAKSIKVSQGGAWVVVPGGTAIEITSRGADWSDVVVDGKPGRAAAKLLLAACPLTPQEELAQVPLAPPTPKRTPSSKKAPEAPAPAPAPAPPAPPPAAPPPPAPSTPAPSTSTPTPTASTPTPTATPPTPSTRALRIAVKAIETDDPNLRRVMTDAVVAELRKLQRISVIGLDEVQAMLDLEAQKQLAGCTESSCISEIAAALGADVLVVGSVVRVNDDVVFGLKRLEQLEGRTDGQVSQRLRASAGEESLAMVGPAIEQLFAEFPLRPGQARGVAPALALRLNPPPVPVWGFGVVAGVAAVATTAAAVAGTVNVVTYAAGQGTLASSAKEPIDAVVVRDQEAALATSFAVTVLAGSVAAVAAVATGVTALFTDWNGYRETPE